MNILFFVLNLNFLNLIKQTNCIFVLKNISQTKIDSELLLLSEYNSSHFIGILDNIIYLFSPFTAQIRTYFSSTSLKSTKIKILEDQTFVLICKENILLKIINNKEDNGINLENNELQFNHDKDHCNVENEKDIFYLTYINYDENKIIYNLQIINYVSGSGLKNPKNKSIFRQGNNNENYKLFIFISGNKIYMIFPEYIKEGNTLQTNITIMSIEKYNLSETMEFSEKIGTVNLINGFKRNENSYITYGQNYVDKKVILLIINFMNESIQIYSYFISSSQNNSIYDTISIFLNDTNQIYISFYDSKNFNLELITLEENNDSNITFIKEFSISSPFYPNNYNITYSKGFLFQNNILVFILKNENDGNMDWKMITFGYVKCEDYIGYLYENEKKKIDLKEIIKKQYNFITFLFLNKIGINLKQSENSENDFNEDYIELELNQEITNFTTKYISYVTDFEEIREKDELNFCYFTLIKCHKSCLKCNEYSNNDLDTKCIICNKDKYYYEFEDDKTRCGLNKYKFENYYFNETIFSKCKANCKYCENNNQCNECHDNYIYTSKKECIKFPCIEKTVWYYQDNKIKCSKNKSCLYSLPFFNIDTYECVNDPNMFNNRNIKKCNKNEYQENLECHFGNITTEGNTTIAFELYNSKQSFPGTSKIDLGKCEEILKDFYDIPKFENLIMRKIETIIENKPTKKVEYEVYDTNYTKLNLSICENERIIISSPIIDKNIIKFDYGKNLSEKGIDIYNSSDDYFNDYCNNIDIGINTDIPLEDRKKDILVNISLCEDGCIYDGINYETELINCKCDKSLFNNEKEEKESNKGNKIMETISNKINYKIVTCYKYLFDLNNLKSNPLFLFSSSVFVVLNIFSILHFTKTFSLLTNKICNSMNLPKEHSTILHKNQKLKPSPIKKKKKKTENKDYERILKDSNIHSTRINDGHSSSFRELDIFKKKKLQKKRNENMYKTKKSKKNKFLNRIINNDIIIKPKEKEEEKDYDEMYYFEASKDDERNLIHITFSNFISKIDLIEILFFPQPYIILFVTLSGYLFSLMIDFTLNSLLFSDDVLSAKYKSGNNTLNFALSELLSIISNIIGNILAYIILKMTNYSYAFELVEKEVKDNETILQIFNKYKKIIKIRLTFYFIVQFICMCLFVYYLTIFCALYKYSMFALFKNYFLGLLTSLFYTLIISIFISLLRYLSLKCGSKKVFMMSKYLNEKL